MKSTLYISGSIFCSLGIFLMGVALITRQELISLFRFLSQLNSTDTIYEINLNCGLYISIAMILIGLVQIFIAFRKKAD